MLCESSNLDKLGSGGSVTGANNDDSLKSSATSGSTNSLSLNQDLAVDQTQTTRASLFRSKNRLHPNIQHHPTIHPKNHYQRPYNLSNKPPSNSEISSKDDEYENIENPHIFFDLNLVSLETRNFGIYFIHSQ